MRTTRIFHPEKLEAGASIHLNKTASHHLIRVLRVKKDSRITIFNGDGHEYSALILNNDPKLTLVQIEDKTPTNGESSLRVRLMQGISRSDRMDLCIQKATELGINTIVPILCQRTTTNLKGARSEKKLEHWNKIIISACEQSGRCQIPALKPIKVFDQALTTVDTDAVKLVLDPNAEIGLGQLNEPAANTPVYILVGPEGGLTTEEILSANHHGFTGIQLGPRILRTETAALACITAIQTLWGDMK